MKYDVFLVSAIADLEKAEMVARRLRALKFKVRFDKKREHTIATPKDVKDANDSKSVLVLWSKTACDTTLPDSDWVHAMAHQARARPDVLLQAGLDRAKPDEPFDQDMRASFIGLEPRKVVKGFRDVAVAIGEKTKRTDLDQWLSFTARQKDEKAAWLKAHRRDPLAIAEAEKRKRKAAAKKAATAATAPGTAKSMPLPEVTKSSRTVRPKPAPLRLKPPVPPTYIEREISSGQIMIGAISAGIAVLFLFSYLSRSTPSGLPGIANAGPVLTQQCPPGQIPAGLLDPLAHGEIIDDTEE